METTPANLNLFFSALETRWSTAFQVYPAWYLKICTTYPVATKSWVSGWMDPTGPMREWLNGRQVEVPGLETYKVDMQIFEKTLGIDMFTLKWDQHGLYYNMAADIGTQGAKWPDYQVRDLLLNQKSQAGLRQYGIDGLTHWNTAHPVDFYDTGKGTYCNDFRGGVSVGGITVGGAFTFNAIKTLAEEFCARKSPNGEALGIEPDLTMVPSQLRTSAIVVLQNMQISPPQMGYLGSTSGANAPFVGPMDNPLRNLTELFVNQDLQGAPNDFYMFHTKGAVKPLGWLLNQAPDFVARTRPDDPEVFMNRNFLYGSCAVGAPAWSFPWLSLKSGPTAV